MFDSSLSFNKLTGLDLFSFSEFYQFHKFQVIQTILEPLSYEKYSLDLKTHEDINKFKNLC